MVSCVLHSGLFRWRHRRTWTLCAGSTLRHTPQARSDGPIMRVNGECRAGVGAACDYRYRWGPCVNRGPSHRWRQTRPFGPSLRRRKRTTPVIQYRHHGSRPARPAPPSCRAGLAHERPTALDVTAPPCESSAASLTSRAARSLPSRGSGHRGWGRAAIRVGSPYWFFEESPPSFRRTKFASGRSMEDELPPTCPLRQFWWTRHAWAAAVVDTSLWQSFA